MSPEIRPASPDDANRVAELAVLAWEPVFESLRRVLGDELFSRLHPDWQRSQAAAVATALEEEATEVWVAESGGAVVGFVAWQLHQRRSTGEIVFLAVAPRHQSLGIGKSLVDRALDRFAEAGMKIALVEAGGDPGHAPARRCYEKAGFRLLPIARYFRAL